MTQHHARTPSPLPAPATLARLGPREHEDAAGSRVETVLALRRRALETLREIAARGGDPLAWARLQLPRDIDALEDRARCPSARVLEPLLHIHNATTRSRGPTFAARCLMEGAITDPQQVRWIAACLDTPVSFWRVLAPSRGPLQLEDVLRDGQVVTVGGCPCEERPESWTVVMARVVHFEGINVFDLRSALAVPSRSIGDLRDLARSLTRSRTPIDNAMLRAVDLAMPTLFLEIAAGHARREQCSR